MPLFGLIFFFLVPFLIMYGQILFIDLILGTNSHEIYSSRFAPWQPIWQHWGYFWLTFLPAVTQLTLIMFGELVLMFTFSEKKVSRKSYYLVIFSVVIALLFPIFIASAYKLVGIQTGNLYTEWWPYWFGWPVFFIVFLVSRKFFPTVPALQG